MKGLTTARRVMTRVALLRWKTTARLRGVTLKVRVHPDARVSPRAALEIFRGPGNDITLDLSAGSRIEPGSLIRLAGGASVVVGPDVLVRRFAVLNVSGSLILHGGNLVSFHSVVHCAERVVFEYQAGTGEGVTVVDGRHYRRDAEDHWYRNTSTSPITIGRNVWLASHSTVGPGVTIGAATTVAAGSVVLEDMPGDALVAGTPAKPIRTAINSGQGKPRRCA